MNGSIKIMSTHLNRQAVVYLRQSDPKQVRQNRESAINQRALQERLRELGWKKEQISVIDGDQGVSAKHAAGRESFQKLVADVGLGKMVLKKFLEAGSAGKVLYYLVHNQLKLPRRQVSGLHVGETLWRDPSSTAIYSILKNPAYAGAFAYGRRRAEPTRQVPGRPATGRIRRPPSDWLALVKNVYPAYITWEEHKEIQRKLEENDQRMKERLARKRAVRQGAALLSGIVRCMKCGHAMQVTYKGRRFQYKCDGARNKYQKPSCQFLSGYRIDDAVVAEFFRVLEPAQIDALEKVSEKQAEHQWQRERHVEQEIVRLEYQAARAERQYNSVDPENRLIAATLETKWESALAELEQARAQLIDVQGTRPSAPPIPMGLREAFANVGRQMPTLWPGLTAEAKKLLLRTLIDQVNLLRHSDGVAHIRIVWRGGSVTETRVQVPVNSFRYTDTEKRVVERMRCLTDEGKTMDQIVTALNSEGLVPCRGGAFTKQIVIKFKKRFRIVSNLEKVRRGEIPRAYTPAELADILKIDRTWIYHRIADGAIRIKKNPAYGCYLFPRTKHCVAQLKRLRKGAVAHVSFPEGHSSG